MFWLLRMSRKVSWIDHHHHSLRVVVFVVVICFWSRFHSLRLIDWYQIEHLPGQAILCDLFGMLKWLFQRLSDLRLGDRKVTLNLASLSYKNSQKAEHSFAGFRTLTGPYPFWLLYWRFFHFSGYASCSFSRGLQIYCQCFVLPIAGNWLFPFSTWPWILLLTICGSPPKSGWINLTQSDMKLLTCILIFNLGGCLFLQRWGVFMAMPLHLCFRDHAM